MIQQREGLKTPINSQVPDADSGPGSSPLWKREAFSNMENKEKNELGGQTKREEGRNKVGEGQGLFPVTRTANPESKPMESCVQASTRR